MNSFIEVIDTLGDELVDGLGVSKGRLAVWKFRKKIPPEYWVPIGALKKAKDEGITAEGLAKLNAAIRESKAAAKLKAERARKRA